MKIVKWTLIVFVVMAVVGGCDTESTVTTVNNNPEIQEVKEDFIFIEEPHLVYENYTTKIVGIVQNNKGYDLNYIDIEFTLYDKDGNNIGTAYANGSNVKAGTNWKFEAYVLEDNIDRFEFVEVGGW